MHTEKLAKAEGLPDRSGSKDFTTLKQLARNVANHSRDSYGVHANAQDRDDLQKRAPAAASSDTSAKLDKIEKTLDTLITALGGIVKKRLAESKPRFQPLANGDTSGLIMKDGVPQRVDLGDNAARRRENIVKFEGTGDHPVSPNYKRFVPLRPENIAKFEETGDHPVTPTGRKRFVTIG